MKYKSYNIYSNKTNVLYMYTLTVKPVLKQFNSNNSGRTVLVANNSA